MQAGDRQGIRLFFSADLAGSSDLKNRENERVDLTDEIAEPEWPIIFQQFFYEIANGFKQAASQNMSLFQEESYPSDVYVWRMAGDEVLFYSSPISKHDDAQILIFTFTSIVEKYDEFYKKKGLGVKGTIWSAGFPIRNKLIRIDPQVSPYFWIDDLRDDPDVPISRKHALWHSPQVMSDFLGPEIDLGFRLTKCSMPGRTVIALDAAVIISKASIIITRQCDTRMFHVGWEVLKGIYGESPYPILWIDTRKPKEIPAPRTSFEESQSQFSQRYLAKDSSSLISRGEILELNDHYYDDTSKYRLKEPYLKMSDKGTPDSHKKTHEKINKKT